MNAIPARRAADRHQRPQDLYDSLALPSIDASGGTYGPVHLRLAPNHWIDPNRPLGYRYDGGLLDHWIGAASDLGYRYRMPQWPRAGSRSASDAIGSSGWRPQNAQGWAALRALPPGAEARPFRPEVAERIRQGLRRFAERSPLHTPTR